MRALLATLLVLAPLAADAEPARIEATGSQPGADLVGRWTLDPDRSDSIKPMMKLMGAPWAVRQFVGALRPTMTVSLTDAGLWVRNKTSARASESEIVPDGERRESKDALERTVTERAAWQNDGTLKVWREISQQDGTRIEIQATWRRNGDTIELDSTARVAGQDPVRTLRVFAADDG